MDMQKKPEYKRKKAGRLEVALPVSVSKDLRVYCAKNFKSTTAVVIESLLAHNFQDESFKKEKGDVGGTMVRVSVRIPESLKKSLGLQRENKKKGDISELISFSIKKFLENEEKKEKEKGKKEK